MIHAIARCSFITSSFKLPDVPISITLHEACSIIESHPSLNELKDMLISEIKTYFYCPSCHKVSNSLMSSNTQIFIFKLTMKNEIVAHPVASKDNGHGTNAEQSCTYCTYSTKNVDLAIYKQVFHKCPLVLLVSFTTI
jgi:hypothetical protein